MKSEHTFADELSVLSEVPGVLYSEDSVADRRRGRPEFEPLNRFPLAGEDDYSIAGLAKTYQDGALVNQSPLADRLLHSGDLYIGGADVFGDDGGFNGLIRKLRIYNRALPVAEVLALCNKGSN